MKRWIRLLAIASLTCFIVLGIHQPTLLRAQTLRSTASSPTALIKAGQQSYATGQFAQAIQELQQAAIAFERNNAPIQQAQSLNLLALAHKQLSQWPAAEKALASSQSLLQQSPDALAQAQQLNAEGHIYLAQGEAETALRSWQQAEQSYQQAQDLNGQLGARINQAQALQSLGFFRRAENQLLEVEQQLQELPDAPLKMIGLHNLGNLRREAGELERSQGLLTEALNIARLTSANMSDTSTIALSLGNTERLLGQRAELAKDAKQALAAYDLAIAHYKTAAATAPSSLAQVQAQLNQLSLERFLGPQAVSQSRIQDLQQAITSLPASRAGVYARANFSHQLLFLGKTDSIPTLLETAIEQAKYLQDQRAQSYAQGVLGRFYENQANFSRAESLTQAALRTSQRLQASDLSYQWQWQMGRLLRAEADLKTERGSGISHDAAQSNALAYYRSALDNLGSLRSDLVALNPDVQFSFRETVEPVYREYIKLLLQPSLSQDTPSQDNLQEARRTLENLQLAELDNFFRDACAQAESVDIDSLDPQATIVYPILLEDSAKEDATERLDLIVKLPGSKTLQYYRTEELPGGAIAQAVEDLQRSLRRRSTSIGQVKRQAGQLYDWLIRPWAVDLPNPGQSASESAPPLIFVMDGPLRNISPAVLYDGEQYLIESYTVAMTPGLQLLDSQPLPQQNINALIAGAANAPSFAAEGLEPIANVTLELEQVGQQVSQSQILADQEFLKANIKQQIDANPFSVVHIATHGQFSSNPEQTYILDWEQRIRVKELDNLLRQSRDEAVTRPIELLILSACETAAGDDRAALGLAGIAIRAGARSTLATLSQVNDASTAQLITNFYTALKAPNQSKAGALRQAQLSFLQNDDPNSDLARPYFWAPFILVGSWL